MNRTLLIGLDGATFTVLDPLMESGVMPFMKKFVANGVRANLMSTAHPLTPPAWTSIMTGRTPGHHGVFDFIWAEERKADHYFTLYNFRDIRCETIWQIVSRQGGTACTLNYPLMSPPPEIDGYIVPGFVSWRHLRRHVHPPELYDRMKALPGFNARELAWDFELEKKAETGVPKEEYAEWVRFHMAREKQWFEVIKDLMTNDPSDLTAILFDGPDKIMHMGYRFIDPATFPDDPEPWEVEIREHCLSYFHEMDRFIGEIVGMAGKDARVFMVSDHGFGPSTEVFRVNTWLAEHGYLKWLDLDGLDEQGRRTAEKVADGHFVVLEWDETTAYARTATSNGIYIRVAREPGQSGVPVDQYEAFRDRLAAELLEVEHPETGEKLVRQVLKREDAFPGPNNGQAADLTLVMRDHGFISTKDKQPYYFERPHVEGTHYPAGIFLAGGPGIRRGQRHDDLAITAVAPSLLYSLGLPIPADFEGEVPAAVFDPALLKRMPVTIGDPTVPPDDLSDAGEASGDRSDEDEQIYKQMKALGYIE